MYSDELEKMSREELIGSVNLALQDYYEQLSLKLELIERTKEMCQTVLSQLEDCRSEHTRMMTTTRELQIGPFNEKGFYDNLECRLSPVEMKDSAGFWQGVGRLIEIRKGEVIIEYRVCLDDVCTHAGPSCEVWKEKETIFSVGSDFDTDKAFSEAEKFIREQAKLPLGPALCMKKLKQTIIAFHQELSR